MTSMVLYLLAAPAAAASWRVLLRPGGVLAASWVIAQDPAWDAAFAAVGAFVPGEGWGAFTARPPWNSAAAVEAVLRGAAYAGVITTAEPVITRYDSLSRWWRSAWMQAPYLIWQHIPLHRRDAAAAPRSASWNTSAHPTAHIRDALVGQLLGRC